MTTGEYLDKDELRQLTGYAYVKQQAEWLQLKGIPFNPTTARIPSL